MIEYEMKLEMGAKVAVLSPNEFILVPFDGSTYDHMMNREELTELRAIIDQALNTSAEELEASEAERERQRYAKVDPDRHIENAFVSTGEACSIRDASKALDA